jgi:hypothetical protein
MARQLTSAGGVKVTGNVEGHGELNAGRFCAWPTVANNDKVLTDPHSAAMSFEFFDIACALHPMKPSPASGSSIIAAIRAIIKRRKIYFDFLRTATRASRHPYAQGLSPPFGAQTFLDESMI